MNPRLAAMALGLTLGTAAAAATLSPEQERRYHALIDELRCLVCQNQTIAESNAPLAADLRETVRDQIVAGRSDAEIKDFVTQRYGDFVLYRPPLKPRTWLLWFGPLVMLLLAGLAAAVFMRRSQKAAPASGADAAAVKRLLDEEER